MRALILLLLFIPLAFENPSYAGAKGRVGLDPNTPSSAISGDATGLIEGCGNQPQVGFTYCRIEEGSSSSQTLWFIGPPSQCDQPEACVFIKVWDNSGQLVWGGSIPKGKTRVPVGWAALLGSPTFEVNHRGTWTWNVEVHFKDPDGRENISKAQGDIVLRVFKHGYIPLEAVSSDPAFVWTWTDGACLYRMTAGLRTYIQCGHSS